MTNGSTLSSQYPDVPSFRLTKVVLGVTAACVAAGAAAGVLCGIPLSLVFDGPRGLLDGGFYIAAGIVGGVLGFAIFTFLPSDLFVAAGGFAVAVAHLAWRYRAKGEVRGAGTPPSCVNQRRGRRRLRAAWSTRLFCGLPFGPPLDAPRASPNQTMKGDPMRTALAVTLLFIGAVPLAAQQPTSADSTQARARQAAAALNPMMQQMAPAMAQVAAITLEATIATLAKQENAEHLADFTKHYYDALIARGFTKEEALQLVMAVGIPRVATNTR